MMLRWLAGGWGVLVVSFRHPGLEPGSRFFFRCGGEEAGPRIKSGVTVGCGGLSLLVVGSLRWCSDVRALLTSPSVTAARCHLPLAGEDFGAFFVAMVSA